MTKKLNTFTQDILPEVGDMILVKTHFFNGQEDKEEINGIVLSKVSNYDDEEAWDECHPKGYVYTCMLKSQLTTLLYDDSEDEWFINNDFDSNYGTEVWTSLDSVKTNASQPTQ